jgi:hypothetical protein
MPIIRLSQCFLFTYIQRSAVTPPTPDVEYLDNVASIPRLLPYRDILIPKSNSVAV